MLFVCKSASVQDRFQFRFRQYFFFHFTPRRKHKKRKPFSHNLRFTLTNRSPANGPIGGGIAPMRFGIDKGDKGHSESIQQEYFYYSLLTISQVSAATHSGYKVTNL